MLDLMRASACSILFACAFWSGESGWARSDPPPNILLIVSEDNGPELGCYGDPCASTPTLDHLAAEGTRFERAFVPFSVCSPSRACYLTGLYPQQNGQLGLATHKFAMYRAFPSMPSLLKAKGYRTGLIGKLHVNPESAFPFDYRTIRSANFGRRDMRTYARAAAEFFQASKQPFFLSINYPDAHFPLLRQQFGLPREPIGADAARPLPWVGADSPRLRALSADYYNCLRRLDDGIALLLAELERAGKAHNTLIAYLGDHGAQFSRGKCSLYEGGLRIPLIIRWPGHARAQVRKELVSTLDLLPTFLSAAGAPVPASLPGRALEPLLEGRAVPWRRYIFAITTGAAPSIAYLQFSVRDERHKLITSPVRGASNLFARAYREHLNVHFSGGTTAEEIDASPPSVRGAYATFERPPAIELYDLRKDPNEFVNLAENPNHAAIRARLLEALRAWQLRIHDPLLEPALRQSFLDELLAARGRPYRRDRTFHWSYADRFPAWIASHR